MADADNDAPAARVNLRNTNRRGSAGLILGILAVAAIVAAIIWGEDIRHWVAGLNNHDTTVTATTGGSPTTTVVNPLATTPAMGTTNPAVLVEVESLLQQLLATKADQAYAMSLEQRIAALELRLADMESREDALVQLRDILRDLQARMGAPTVITTPAPTAALPACPTVCAAPVAPTAEVVPDHSGSIIIMSDNKPAGLINVADVRTTCNPCGGNNNPPPQMEVCAWYPTFLIPESNRAGWSEPAYIDIKLWLEPGEIPPPAACGTEIITDCNNCVRFGGQVSVVYRAPVVQGRGFQAPPSIFLLSLRGLELCTPPMTNGIRPSHVMDAADIQSDLVAHGGRLQNGTTFNIYY